MPHLIRAGGLLAVVLVLALAVRSVLTPDPLAFSSTYRRANVGEWASWPVRLVGAASCTDCHKEIVDRLQASRHKTLPCEDCHGATQPHVDNKASLVVDRSRDFCATCHGKNVTRPASFPQVDVSNHWGDTPCAACHNPHGPSRYRPEKLPHAVADYEDCLSCHRSGATAPGSSDAKPVPADHKSYVNNRCLSCHAAK